MERIILNSIFSFYLFDETFSKRIIIETSYRLLFTLISTLTRLYVPYLFLVGQRFGCSKHIDTEFSSGGLVKWLVNMSFYYYQIVSWYSALFSHVAVRGVYESHLLFTLVYSCNLSFKIYFLYYSFYLYLSIHRLLRVGVAIDNRPQ